MSRIDPRLVALITAVVLGAVVAVTVAAARAGAAVAPPRWNVIGAIAVLLLGEIPLATMRFGSQREAYSLSEFSLVVALASLPSAWLPLLLPVVLIAQLALRRPPLKALFNVATVVAAGSVAAVVAWAVEADRTDLGDLRVIGALAAAALVYSALNATLVVAAVALSSGQSFRNVLFPSVWLRLAITVVNVLLGVWFMREVRDHAGGLLLILPAFMVVAAVAYRGYVRAIDERDLWRQLESATKSFALLDIDAVVDAASIAAVGVFRSDAATVVVHGHRRDDVASVHRASAGGTGMSLPAPEDVELPADPDAASGAMAVHYLAQYDATCAVLVLPFASGLTGELRIWYAGRVRVPQRVSLGVRTFGQAIAAAVTNAVLHRDVAELAARKSYEAEHDALTGLANRALLLTHAHAALHSARSTGRVCALILLDLDHFKTVNDTLGHAAGDMLLRAVAARLSPAVRSADVVARLGGDEFAVLVHDVDSETTAMRIARTIVRLVGEPVVINDIEIAVQGSAGVACGPEDGTDIALLLQRADAALYVAKRNRGSVHRFDPDSVSDAGIDRLALGAELRGAIDRHELRLAYQPQVDLRTRRIVAYEALVRWMHPTRGLVMPHDFIAVAEQSELITSVTSEVLDQAVAEAAGWRGRAGDPPPSVAVNVSARSALDLGLCDDVAAVLDRYAFPPDRLKIEITETAVFTELDAVSEVLARLRNLGVQICVDDFGTGNASLTFLRRMPVDEVKVDRSFVVGMATSQRDAALVRATVDLARSFGLVTVAEGVESEVVAHQLAELGVDLAQGYWFAEPVWPEEIGTLDLAAIEKRAASTRLH